MKVTGPELLYKNFVECFNRGDLFGLSNLYGSVAVLRTQQGETVYGRHQIADVLRKYLALGGTMTLATRFKLQTGDTALMSAQWTLYAGTEDEPIVLSGISMETCRRISAEEWQFVCSNWQGAPSENEASQPSQPNPIEPSVWA
jgi:ketosteroid isomerase-like protein